MILAEQEIAKAKARAAAVPLAELAETHADKTPADLAGPKDRRDRLQFLRKSQGDTAQTLQTFERIIAGNELQPVNYLELGVLAGRPVCRIRVGDAGGRVVAWATGFLIAPQVLITNNHVLPSQAVAASSSAQFDYELDVFGGETPLVEFDLRPDDLFYTTEDLDFAICAVAPAASDGAVLSTYGFLPLIGAVGKVMDGEWLSITQHPNGERKQVCVRENHLLTRTDDVLWYSTDTLGGSSGSPVFNNDWQVVALHHSGVPEEKNGVPQTVDGRDYDPNRDPETAVKWIANEGVRVSRIVDRLKSERPGHPLLADVFEMTPARARAVTEALLAALPRPAAQSANPPQPPEALRLGARSAAAMSRSVTVTLDIAEDGRVSVRGSSAQEAAFTAERSAAAPPKPRPPEYDVPFDPDYTKRKGYDAGYLGGGVKVDQPTLGPDLQALAAPRLDGVAGVVLDYDGYSLVMNKARRLAIYSAANVDGGDRFKLSRPADDWRIDPRISRNHQLGGFYYEHNKFDRGHLTRREDMEYGGTPVQAIARAADTCHFTNCTPQHSAFNQGKQLWQGLERHVLEDSISAATFAAQVFTGPVLDEGDPSWKAFPDIQYPVRFWKIAVAMTSAGKLFAAGFVLDQSEAIAQFGIEEAVEVPFSAFKTFQTPIAEIERLTGLTFTCTEPGGATALREVDPMRTNRAATRRAALQPTEALGVAEIPAGYVLLTDASSIIRPAP